MIAWENANPLRITIRVVMIDEYWTWIFYGYHSDELSHGSGKKIVVVCDNCYKYRTISMCDYRDLCFQCARKSDTTRKRQSDSWKPENHPTIGNFGKENHMFGKRGAETSFYGRHHTDEAKQILSEKASLRCGENNGNWKGGITKWRDYIHRTPAYNNWRAAVYERDDYTCQMCGDDSGGNLQAHHIRPVRDHKNDLLLFDINNGITLCKK